jgi:hypothetical protein
MRAVQSASRCGETPSVVAGRGLYYVWRQAICDLDVRTIGSGPGAGAWILVGREAAVIRVRFGLLVVLATLMCMTACEEDTVSPPPEEKPTWSLEPDSMNLGILVLDYLSYELKGGRVDHYALCDSCDRDSLPFEQIYEPPNDYGSVTFRYTETGDTLLYASVIWIGPGRIEYPRKFLPASIFTRVNDLPDAPLSIEYFYNSRKTQPFAEGEAAWFRVRTLDVVREFATSPYRVGVYWHIARDGEFVPELDSWVVFLYRGRLATP